MNDARDYGGDCALRRFLLLAVVSIRRAAVCIAFGLVAVLQPSGAVAEQSASVRLDEFFSDLFYSIGSSENMVNPHISCVPALDIDFQPLVFDCTHRKTQIGFLLTSEPGNEAISVAFTYHGNASDGSGAVSTDGSLIVAGLSDLQFWEQEFLTSKKHLEEKGFEECVISESSDGATQRLKNISFHNAQSDRRVVVAFVIDEALSVAKIDWASIEEGEIVGSLLVVSMSATPCQLID